MNVEARLALIGSLILANVFYARGRVNQVFASIFVAMNGILAAIYRKDDFSLGRLLQDHRTLRNADLNEALKFVLCDEELEYHVKLRYGEMLLCAGANPNCKMWDKGPILLHLVEKEDLGMFELLMNFAPDVNLQNEDGQTALHVAAKACHELMIGMLLAAGANCNKKNEAGDTPLCVALAQQRHDIDAIRLLLIQSDINQKNNKGETCLHLAVMQNKLDALELLLGDLGRCKCLDVQDKLHNTALMYAADSCEAEAAKLLVQAGCEVNIINHMRNTALQKAVLNPVDGPEGEELVSLLIGAGSDIDSKNMAGNTALFSAVYAGNWKAARQLIMNNCDVNLTGHIYRSDEFSPLEVSIMNDDLYSIYMLLAAGCDFKKHLVEQAIAHLMTLRLSLDQTSPGEDNFPFEEIISHIQHCISRPVSLRLSCRKQIRLILGKNVLDKLEKLSLPSKLIDFLSLKEFLKLI